MALKALIIDDEPSARELVRHYLNDVDDVEVIGEAENGFEAVKRINTDHPDVIFLDIQMPKLNGFEMLELLDSYIPQVIFCTAYDEYAIKAFEKNATDYLLKPFSRERLLEAVEKAQSKPEKKGMEKKEVGALALDHKKPIDRIVVKDRDKIEIIPVENIQFLESQDDYVEIHTYLGKKFLKQQRMKFYESALDDLRFVRVHRRFIVNIEGIQRLEKFGKESYVAVLKSNTQVPVSASGYPRLKEILGI